MLSSLLLEKRIGAAVPSHAENLGKGEECTGWGLGVFNDKKKNESTGCPMHEARRRE